MISSCFVTGRLGKVIDPTTRYVEVDRVLPDDCGTYSVDRIPVRTYSGKGCLFMVAPEGSYIGLKGHLETREEFGVLVYLEFEEIFPMKVKS